jgi:hypothetical protein
MNGRVRSYSAPSAVDSYWAGIEPTGLTLHYVKSEEQNEDGGAIYHWHLQYPQEDEWSGDTDILNTPPKTNGPLATLADIANEIAKIVGGADTSYDTLKEIADWIKAHPNDVAALVTRISALESGKLDKVTTIGNKRVYGVDIFGNNIMCTLGTAAVNNTIPIRDTNGTFDVSTPVRESNPATKDYVDKRTPSLLFRGDLA